jgi:hypothetical protein
LTQRHGSRFSLNHSASDSELVGPPHFSAEQHKQRLARKAYAIIVMSMTAKALPGSPLEVIETEFFSQLLVSPLANPSRLDGCLVISPSVAAFPSLGAVSSKSQQSMLSDFRAV